MKPVVVLDGVPHAIKDLQGRHVGDIAYLVGVNQRSFKQVMGTIFARVFHFYEMRVFDLSALADHHEIEELAIHWNTKIEDISPICRLSKLKILVLANTPKANDLSPLEDCRFLETLDFSGGIWSKNRAESLKSIAKMPSIKALTLLNIAVKKDGLKPLAAAAQLRVLELSNQFPTDDYAYLAARLPHVSCDYFAPYVEMNSPIEDNDVMVIGSRKPFLNSQRDRKKLEKYEAEFRRLRLKYEQH